MKSSHYRYNLFLGPNLKRAFAIILIYSLWIGCAQEYKPGKQEKRTNLESGVQSLDTKSSVSPEEMKKELVYLRAINDKLCKRVQKQRSECAGSVTLISETSRDIMNCITGFKEGAKLEDSFELDFTMNGASGSKVMLKANSGQFTTQPVLGLAQKVQFTTVRSQAVKSPKLYDLIELLIVPETDSTKLKVESVANFQFKVNGITVLNKEDFRGATLADANYLTLDMKKILALQSDAKCKIPVTEIDTISQEAREETKDAEVQNLGDVPSTSAELTPILNRERSVRQQYTSHLTGLENLGCWASVKMEKLEILVEGAHLNESSRGRGSNQMSNRGNSNQYDIVFGESLKLSNADESTQGLFRPGGRLLTEDFQEFEISQIRALQITRQGDSFRSVQVSKPGFLGIGGWTGFDNFEVNRTSLASLKIKVNNEILYERNAIGHVFESGRNTWEDKNITKNAAFLKLMQRNDCPTTGSTTTHSGSNSTPKSETSPNP